MALRLVGDVSRLRLCTQILQALPQFINEGGLRPANSTASIDGPWSPERQHLQWQPLHTRLFRSSSLVHKTIEVEIQSMGESITEGQIAEILKKEGDTVKEDETIAQIETDKVTIDVKAPATGKISELRVSIFLRCWF